MVCWNYVQSFIHLSQTTHYFSKSVKIVLLKLVQTQQKLEQYYIINAVLLLNYEAAWFNQNQFHNIA